jgi:deoxyribonuclease-4
MNRVGAHLSIAGGMHRAVESIVEKGGNCLQIFSGSPRGWQMKRPAKTEVEKFRELCQRNDVEPVFIHAKYLINLAANKREVLRLSKQSLINDLQVAEMIGAQGVIVHLGSHMGDGFEAVKDQLVGVINEILQASRVTSQLIIENSAGQQGKIASQLSEISLLIQVINNRRLRWCLDACHAFAAGYSLGKSSENTLIQNDIVAEAEKLGILAKLVCLHINDSRDGFGSGRDRHANLGAGRMGLEELAAYVNHPKLKGLPMIIETPGFNQQGPDKKNLEILKSLIRSAH